MRQIESKRLTTRDFIERSKKTHNNKYDYSHSIYSKAKNKIIIRCNEHGIFEQIAFNHMNGDGCSKCAVEKNKVFLSEDEWNIKRIAIHGNKYECLDKYVNSKTKIRFKCNLNVNHKIFFQIPNNHLSGSESCPYLVAANIKESQLQSSPF
ncbi:MAG: hypothetical protein JST43_12375, partial [Bacteroidetes bacterium]|nr:hypothetical protein [Bacteroidota bacterium]